MTFESWPLRNHLPPEASKYCFQLWEQYQFKLKITAPRKTKLGDYRFRANKKEHIITINRDLNPFAFLVVYLHETAHCSATTKHGLRIRPHGHEWQEEMKSLLNPMLDSSIFPNDVERSLISYMKAPKAASCAHPELTRALRCYDPPTSQVALEQLKEGTEFLFQSRRYRKITTRRTRVSCLEINRKRTYLISKLALVTLVGAMDQ